RRYRHALLLSPGARTGVPPCVHLALTFNCLSASHDSFAGAWCGELHDRALHPIARTIAQSAIPATKMDLGAVCAFSAGSPAAAGRPGPLHLASRSESVIRGAGCPNWASPDLPGGPGRETAQVYPVTSPKP